MIALKVEKVAETQVEVIIGVQVMTEATVMQGAKAEAGIGAFLRAGVEVAVIVDTGDTGA